MIFELILLLLAIAVLIFVFFRRWSLLEKGSLFGKMVLKKEHAVPSGLKQEDYEVTAKEMIPSEDTVDPKLIVKGENLFKKAELELKRGNLEDTEKLLIQAISMNPSHLDSHAKLASIYMSQQSYGKAELIYRKLVIALPEEALFHSNLGMSLFAQKKYFDAKQSYEKALEIDDQRTGRYCSLSRIHFELGDYEDAILNIEKALQLDPDNVEYGLVLANYHKEVGNKEKAKDIVNNILEHFPESEDAKEMLKELKKK